jgi:acyl-CoA reductase-like NAD-dependent aldehyde dehydrogenase
MSSQARICHLSYRRGMTGPLEEALRRVESLPREEQDAVAAQIMDALDDEDAWARSFRQRPELLRSLAREAMEEHRRGETRPIDELLG